MSLVSECSFTNLWSCSSNPHRQAEKLFNEVILQIGNKDNMAAVSEEGQLAAKVLDEYMRDFQ